MRIRVSMLAIIDEAGRKFNANEADGVSRRHRLGHRAEDPPPAPAAVAQLVEPEIPAAP